MDDVLLSFEAHFSALVRGIEAPGGAVVGVVDDFGADEALGDVVVDGGGGLECVGAGAERPGAGVVFASGEESDKAEGVVDGADELLPGGFGEPVTGEELFAVGGVELGELFFEGGADGEGLGALAGELGHFRLESRAEGAGLAFVYVVGDDAGFGAEELVVADDLLLFFVEVHGADGETVFEGGFEFVEESLFEVVGAAGALNGLGAGEAFEAVFDDGEVGEDDFDVNGAAVPGGVERVVVGHSAFEGADDVDEEIGFPGLIEEPLAEHFAGRLDRFGVVAEGDGGGGGLFGFDLGDDGIESGVGDGNSGDVAFSGGASHGSKEGGFADVAVTDENRLH